MRNLFLLGLLLGFSMNLQPPLHAIDLKKTDRSIRKEPIYRSKRPSYGLLVFGAKAQARVWLVLDDDVLYVDRNGDGNLTGVRERVEGKNADEVSREVFLVEDLNLRTGETTRRYPRLAVMKGSGTGIAVETASGLQFAAFDVKFADRPARAPIVHFDGPLTLMMEVAENRRTPSWAPGDQVDLRVCIGTRGLGEGVIAALCHQEVQGIMDAWGLPPSKFRKDKSLRGFHPVAQVEFPVDPKAGKFITTRLVLNERCCGIIFHAPVRVPVRATEGKAKVTLSLPDWKTREVAPAVLEVPLVDSAN